MSIGVSSSLNLTLARLSSIESNFKALEAAALQIEAKQNASAPNQVSDFQKILDKKIEEKKDPLEEVNEIEDELTSNEISNEAQKPEGLWESLSEGVEEKILSKEAINLKSKLDLKAQSANMDEIIQTFADKYNIDSSFIKAIIKQESGFNPNATSKKGAMGLMQLMPKTAKSLGVADAYNPWQNIEGGVKHLRGLLDRYDNNYKLALAAYNAGSGAVSKYGGIPPYKETQNYVKSIMATYNKTKEARI